MHDLNREVRYIGTKSSVQIDHLYFEWNELLPFACYCYNILPSCNGTKPPYFLMFGHEPTES